MYLTAKRRLAVAVPMVAAVLAAAAGCAHSTAKPAAAAVGAVITTTTAATTSTPTTPSGASATESPSGTPSPTGRPGDGTPQPAAASTPKPGRPSASTTGGTGPAVADAALAALAPPPPPPVPAASLPNAAAAAWQPMGGLVAMTVPASGAVGLGECAKVAGAAAWHEQGYVSAQRTPAQDDVFGFADVASATRAYQAIADGLNACQQTTRDVQQHGAVPTDAVVTSTATTPQGLAWSRTWTGVPGASAGGPQTNHYYLVRHGATVVVAAFTEFGANPADRYDTTGDPAVLTMLAANAAS